MKIIKIGNNKEVRLNHAKICPIYFCENILNIKLIKSQKQFIKQLTKIIKNDKNNK